MKSKIVGIFFTLGIALAILSVSLIKTAHIEFAYNPLVLSEAINIENKNDIGYVLPYPGGVLPDSPLWYLKVIRDKILHLVTIGSENQAELSLNCSDKRLVMAKMLLEKGKPDLGYEVLLKGEGYLKSTLEHKKISDDLVHKIALSSLKHREVIEEDILPKAPEDLKPEIIKTLNNSKETYKESRDILRSRGLPIPHNPFDIE